MNSAQYSCRISVSIRERDTAVIGVIYLIPPTVAAHFALQNRKGTDSTRKDAMPGPTTIKVLADPFSTILRRSLVADRKDRNTAAAEHLRDGRNTLISVLTISLSPAITAHV